MREKLTGGTLRVVMVLKPTRTTSPFMQGFRYFRDDSFVDPGANPGLNLNPSTEHLTDFHRDEPTRGKVNYTRLSLHTLVAKRLDLTARYIYSNAKSNSVFSEGFTGVNFNARVSGWPPTPPNSTPNTLNPGTYTIGQDVERPNHIGDFGATWLVFDRLRFSDTFRVEDFQINGLGSFSDFFSITRPVTGGTQTDTVGFTNLPVNVITGYRKYQNTTTRVRRLDHGRTTITRTYHTHRCVFTSGGASKGLQGEVISL